jgi:hypothetical protein
MLDDYPKIKLVGVSFIVIVVTILVFILVYQHKIRGYLNKNWVELRCNPWVMALAGFADTAEGNSYMEKVNSNFNKCMNVTLQGTFSELLKPFMTLMTGIVDGLKKIGNVLNSCREVISSTRTLFQAFVGNTTDKLSNSYAALIYLREKMKSIIKRQVAIMEILQQFLKAFPFLFYSLANGPLPRFARWFMRYIGLTIAVIAICILCLFGKIFVSLFACPICALCFTEDSIVGLGEYKKAIVDINIGDNLDENTIVTGKIFIKGCDNYPYHIYTLNNVCKVTGSHAVYINNKWTRVDKLGIESVKQNCNLVCLITNNNLIPTEEYLFKDYMETDEEALTIQQQDKIKDFLNYKTNSPKKININRPKSVQGFSYDTVKKIILNEDNMVYGYITIKDDNVEWYDYDNMIVTGNQLVYEEGQWIRVYESYKSKKIENEEKLVYNVICIEGILKLNGILLRDFLETHNEEIQYELLKELDNYHNK